MYLGLETSSVIEPLGLELLLVSQHPSVLKWICQVPVAGSNQAEQDKPTQIKGQGSARYSKGRKFFPRSGDASHLMCGLSQSMSMSMRRDQTT